MLASNVIIKIHLIFAVIIVLFVQSTTLYAQEPLLEKFKKYEATAASTEMFVHFDKNVYTNREMVWFTSYLLSGSEVDLSKHKVLSVALIRNIDSAVVLQDKFALSYGIASGNIMLPDSLQTGDYHFICHTDRTVNMLPTTIFIQPVNIKTINDVAIQANVELVNKASMANKINSVLITVLTGKATYLRKPAKVSYSYGAL